ncbi:hypothetical protein FKM82_004952 [Ascaphus truei]
MADQIVALTRQVAVLSDREPTATPPDVSPHSAKAVSSSDVRIPPPKPYAGEPQDCRGFLNQCEVQFEMAPHLYNTDRKKVAYIYNLLTGSALAWASPVWERRSDLITIGQGVILEGTLVDFSRHLITDTKGKKERWYILYLRPSKIHRRKFDNKGNEMEPDFSDTKKVNTGFLMSSYKVEPKGETDRISTEELKRTVNKLELVGLTERHAPTDTVAFWLPEAEVVKTELELGEQLRVKTLGDGPFLFSIAKIDSGTATKCNFAGDAQTGASWTDNIMAKKSQDCSSACGPRELGDGAEDDEWDN